MVKKNSTHTKTLKKKLKREKKIREIIDATIELCNKEGLETLEAFGKISTKDIADKLLVTKQTIYNYFPSKYLIFLSITIRAYDMLLKMFQESILNSTAGAEQIELLGRIFFEFSQQYPVLYQSLHYQVFIEKDKRIKTNVKNSREYALLMEKQAQFRDLWLKTIDAGKKDKSIRRDIPTPLIALTLSSLTSGLIQELEHSQLTNALPVDKSVIYNLALELLKNGLTLGGRESLDLEVKK